MTLPADLPAALALLGELIHDDRLRYGLGLVFGILVLAGLMTWALGKASVRR